MGGGIMPNTLLRAPLSPFCQTPSQQLLRCSNGKTSQKKVIFPPVSQFIYAHSRRYHIRQVCVGGPSKSPTQILCAKIGSFNLKPQKLLKHARSYKILHCLKKFERLCQNKCNFDVCQFYCKKSCFHSWNWHWNISQMHFLQNIYFPFSPFR